jgi:predicted nucleic acid-binding protein
MTLVVDASAAVEFVLGSTRGRAVHEVLGEHRGDLHAPELLVTESLSALRLLERLGELTRSRADEAADDIMVLPVHRYPSTTLARRVWRLRGRFTVYDAHYIALAEGLDATVITCDRRPAVQAARSFRS